MSKIEKKQNTWSRTVRGGVSLFLLVGLPFLVYGSVNWTAGWAFVIITIAAKRLFGYYLERRDPELVARRQQIQDGTKSWDKVWLVLYFTAFFAILVLAGLDAGRFHWSKVPVPGMVMGGVIYMMSMVLTVWAMAVNTHFEGTVRIQKDRGHKVIDVGPYRYIRHPGYAFLIVTMLSIPALLGSWVAFLPAGITTVLFIVRTVLEDRTLQNELVGYKQYTKIVRHRLVPGVW